MWKKQEDKISTRYTALLSETTVTGSQVKTTRDIRGLPVSLPFFSEHDTVG